MEIQTPVIQINRSHSGRVVIRDENLRMDKSRRILIDLNPASISSLWSSPQQKRMACPECAA